MKSYWFHVKTMPSCRWAPSWTEHCPETTLLGKKTSNSSFYTNKNVLIRNIGETLALLHLDQINLLFSSFSLCPVGRNRYFWKPLEDVLNTQSRLPQLAKRGVYVSQYLHHCSKTGWSWLLILQHNQNWNNWISACLNLQLTFYLGINVNLLTLC